MSSPVRVFLSSTSEDLRYYRAVARNEIVGMEWQPIMMEDFGAIPTPTIDACRERIRSCDLMVLIVAFRRGWVPTVNQGGDGLASITVHELAYARERNIPVLAFLASEEWPGSLWEDNEPARAAVKQFRSSLNLPAVFFEYEKPTDHDLLPAFRVKVREELIRQRERWLERRAGQPVNGLDYFERARGGVLDGSSIPFFGTDVYGQGPLSSNALARALTERLGEDGDHSVPTLATAAEYLERYFDNRSQFLQAFAETVIKQRSAAAIPAVYELFSTLKPPPLLVSATYDLTLEEKLAEHKPVIVAHIVRSLDGRHDGKILVSRGKDEREVCLADKIDLRDASCIVYKPLGSPLLHRSDDPEELDTVVVTETDHLMFLGRLENQHTQIPAMFSRYFQRRPLLFLGYTLDVWQYRLVVQVFQSVGRKGTRGSLLSARVPSSPMEALAWERLGASLLRLDANDFASRVRDSRGMP